MLSEPSVAMNGLSRMRVTANALTAPTSQARRQAGGDRDHRAAAGRQHQCRDHPGQSHRRADRKIEPAADHHDRLPKSGDADPGEIHRDIAKDVGRGEEIGETKLIAADTATSATSTPAQGTSTSCEALGTLGNAASEPIPAVCWRTRTFLCVADARSGPQRQSSLWSDYRTGHPLRRSCHAP